MQEITFVVRHPSPPRHPPSCSYRLRYTRHRKGAWIPSAVKIYVRYDYESDFLTRQAGAAGAARPSSGPWPWPPLVWPASPAGGGTQGSRARGQPKPLPSPAGVMGRGGEGC